MHTTIAESIHTTRTSIQPGFNKHVGKSDVDMEKHQSNDEYASTCASFYDFGNLLPQRKPWSIYFSIASTPPQLRREMQ